MNGIAYRVLRPGALALSVGLIGRQLPQCGSQDRGALRRGDFEFTLSSRLFGVHLSLRERLSAAAGSRKFRGCLSDGNLQYMTIQESGECYMPRRKLIDLSRANKFLEKFCEKEHIPLEEAQSQIHGNSIDLGVILCVSNPEALEPDGLANDIETLMLPTLYIREDENRELYAVETEYTDQYLRGLTE